MRKMAFGFFKAKAPKAGLKAGGVLGVRGVGRMARPEPSPVGGLKGRLVEKMRKRSV